jgi:hypothetical protein
MYAICRQLLPDVVQHRRRRRCLSRRGSPVRIRLGVLLLESPVTTGLSSAPVAPRGPRPRANGSAAEAVVQTTSTMGSSASSQLSAQIHGAGGSLTLHVRTGCGVGFWPATAPGESGGTYRTFASHHAGAESGRSRSARKRSAIPRGRCTLPSTVVGTTSFRRIRWQSGTGNQTKRVVE